VPLPLVLRWQRGGGVRGLRHPAFGLAAVIACAVAAQPAPASARLGGTSIVAQATGSRIAVFRTPRSTRPFRELRNPIASGVPLVFLVRRRVPGWEQVRLPTRPNGSLGWVRSRTVALSLDPYRIVVSLRQHRITVWRRGRLLVRAAAAAGRSTLPTPTGVFYINELLKQPDPRGLYGPYAFGLSAHSDVLYSFGGGPGQIGLHGTNEPALVGTGVSHGCIRVTNAVISRLARILPLGTMVVIRR
jgi:lipoprotein-anchoring transpeptidase ErfK/SrfK